jgi:hypothetical protein
LRKQVFPPFRHNRVEIISPLYARACAIQTKIVCMGSNDAPNGVVRVEVVHALMRHFLWAQGCRMNNAKLLRNICILASNDRG